MTRDLIDTVPAEVLAAFSFEGASSELFTQGNVNTHWLATRESESLVFGRYHPSRPRAAVAWAQTLVEFAGAAGWPVAPPLAVADGATVLEFESRLWEAAPFIEGEHPSVESIPMHHIYGRLLGRLHHDIAGFPVEGQRPATGKLWELDAWVAPAESGTFNDLLAEFAREHAELGAAIRRHRYRNLRELSRLHYPDLPDHPIHGDWGPSNLLWKDGHLAGVLDFDWCRRDALACDIAAFLPWDDVSAAKTRSLLEGYDESRPLDDAEWALLPALARAHLLFFIAFRLVEWKMVGGERPVHSIGRTLAERLPRTETLGEKLLAIRRGQRTPDRR